MLISLFLFSTLFISTLIVYFLSCSFGFSLLFFIYLRCRVRYWFEVAFFFNVGVPSYASPSERCFLLHQYVWACCLFIFIYLKIFLIFTLIFFLDPWIVLDCVFKFHIFVSFPVSFLLFSSFNLLKFLEPCLVVIYISLPWRVYYIWEWCVFCCCGRSVFCVCVGVTI